MTDLFGCLRVPHEALQHATQSHGSLGQHLSEGGVDVSRRRAELAVHVAGEAVEVGGRGRVRAWLGSILVCEREKEEELMERCKREHWYDNHDMLTHLPSL